LRFLRDRLALKFIARRTLGNLHVSFFGQHEKRQICSRGSRQYGSAPQCGQAVCSADFVPI
jgi:hypothetical protein